MEPRRVAAFVACLASFAAGTASAQTTIPPLPVTGPYPVGCTNVEQDLSRLAPGETAEQYWRGLAGGGKVRYVTALLVSPSDALTGTFFAPGDRQLYDRWAGQPLEYAYIACYPTTAQNGRADYVLPDGVVVPRMQRGSEAPLLAHDATRYPVLVYSHGYGGSPLSGTYLDALMAFASWGFVTVAPFHGDLRYSVLGPDETAFSTMAYIPVWSEFVAMQATRPLSTSNGLDVLLGHPQWRDRVDSSRIGAFGISQGGETVMLLAGAELTFGLFSLDSKPVTLDARIRAGVGYVPYFGLGSLPAFGRGQQGAAGLKLPFLALSGTDDPIAPQQVVRQALDRMAGVRGHVLFDGLGHELNPTTAADIVTWSLGFLSAWVLDDSAAKARLQTVNNVEGGLADRKDLYIDPNGIGGTPGEVVDTIEYYNAGIDHYFITAFPEEAAMLDEGVDVPGWTRTGHRFKSWKTGTGPGNDACRFFGTPGRGPNSHFYTISAAECEQVKSNPDWTFEARAFRALEPLSYGCDAAYDRVTRLYNNGMGGEANHRYLTDPQEIDRMVAKGWLVEGTVFCVPR
jgi:dienelactone hydrolase